MAALGVAGIIISVAMFKGMLQDRAEKQEQAAQEAVG